MSGATTALDFFGLDKPSAAASSASHRRRNYRRIQKTISQISPELLKSVIAGPSAPTVDRVKLPSSPVTESSKEAPPMTIFFNGTVSVFNVPRDRAESIMKAAMEGSSAGPLTGDLPLYRRMSLQRFLEKRKARLNCISPYMCNSNNS